MIPEAAFTLQADLFQTEDGSKTMTRVHFTAGALRVWPVSVIINANLVVPVLVTAAALQDAEPEFRNGAWEWTTTTAIDNQTVAFTLRGNPDGSQVDWSMNITASDPIFGQTYDDFELYTAQTDTRSQTGSWQLYYRINGTRQNVLNADFEVFSDDEVAITYSIPAAQPNGGTSVLYAVDGDARRFFWDQVTEGFQHDVEWNATSHIGSITATNHNDGEQGCWDENLDDVDC